jgi:excisionase family DNA binding protein
MKERRDSVSTMRDPAPPHLISKRVAARLSGEVMDLNGICKFLGFSRSKMKRLIKDGTVPCEKIGKQWRFRHADILSLWDRNK